MRFSASTGHLAYGERSGKEEDVVPVVLVPAPSTAVVGGRSYEGEKGRTRRGREVGARREKTELVFIILT